MNFVSIDQTKDIMNSNMKVLFVCTGNVCRSPVCEYVCRHKTCGRVFARSAAISWHHQHEAADKRTQMVCKEHGIDISCHRARQLRWDDWVINDVIVALDCQIYDTLMRIKPISSEAQIVLFASPKGIFDPFFGGRTGFEKMFKEIDNTMIPFLESIKAI